MPKHSKIAWRSWSDAVAPQPVKEPEDEDEAVAGLRADGDATAAITLDAALAGLGIGRKQCRQLRAELRLEDDSFHCLQRQWRRDERRTESALHRLLPKAAEQVILLLEVESAQSAQTSPVHNSASASGAGQVPVGLMVDPIGADEDISGDVEVKEPSSRGNEHDFEEVWRLLPRMVPSSGSGAERQGHEERGRALRRRLKALLTEEGQQMVKQQLLREEGVDGADRYLRQVHAQLHGLERRLRVELLVEIITSQAHDLQRALRGAVERQVSGAGTGGSATASAPRKRSGDLLVLPEAYLLQMLGFCCTGVVLSRLGACSAQLQLLASQDLLWRQVWRTAMGEAMPVPESQVRRRLLMHLACQCVECGELTDFEHVILGCRLCEACERSHSRYALIRSSLAIREFQLPLSAMQQLPGVDGSTGRVFLRSMVQQLAERQHTQESLQQLRAKNDLGHSTCGRQRGPKGRRQIQSGMPKPSKEDLDPCCFEATALRRADVLDLEDEGTPGHGAAANARQSLPRSARRNWWKR